MEFEQLLQLVESNAKSIEAISSDIALLGRNAETTKQELAATRAIVDSSAKAILALTEQATGDRLMVNELSKEIRELKESSLVQRDVANALLKIGSDHEKRLTQLVGYSITGESDRLDLLERVQKVERRVDGLEKG